MMIIECSLFEFVSDFSRLNNESFKNSRSAASRNASIILSSSEEDSFTIAHYIVYLSLSHSCCSILIKGQRARAPARVLVFI